MWWLVGYHGGHVLCVGWRSGFADRKGEPWRCGMVGHRKFLAMYGHPNIAKLSLAVNDHNYYENFHVCPCRWTVVRRDRTNWSSDVTRLHHWLDRRRALQRGHHSNVVSRRQGLLTSPIRPTSKQAADVQLPKYSIFTLAVKQENCSFLKFENMNTEGGILA